MRPFWRTRTSDGGTTTWLVVLRCLQGLCQLHPLDGSYIRASHRYSSTTELNRSPRLIPNLYSYSTHSLVRGRSCQQRSSTSSAPRRGTIGEERQPSSRTHQTTQSPGWGLTRSESPLGARRRSRSTATGSLHSEPADPRLFLKR